MQTIIKLSLVSIIFLGLFSLNITYAQSFEGFEDWNDTTAAPVPLGWITSGDADDPSIERVPALTEGRYALNMKTNSYGLEGPYSTIAQSDLPFFSDNINISFSYRCVNSGYCKIYLGQGSLDKEGINTREIWQTENADSSIKKVILQNITINPPFDVFKNITISSEPYYTPTHSYGLNSFTIDSLVIEQNTITAIESREEPGFTIWPNPTSHYLNLGLPSHLKVKDKQIYLYSITGRMLKLVKNHERIDLSNFSPGVYLLKIIIVDQVLQEKVIKY